MASLIAEPPRVNPIHPGAWYGRYSPDRVARAGGLTPPELRVALALDARASPHRPFCWPRLAELGAAVGMARSTLRVRLNALERKGWVERVRAPRRYLLGFVLTRRVWAGATAADSPDRRAAAEAAIRRPRGPERVEFPTRRRAEKLRTESAAFCVSVRSFSRP